MNGDLNPECYVRYSNQDSYYLDNGVDLWKYACEMAEGTDFQNFCLENYKSYIDYAETFRKSINVRKGGIVPNKATYDYVTDEIDTLNNLGYLGILLTNYACYEVWPLIANRIKDQTKEDRNPYYQWV